MKLLKTVLISLTLFGGTAWAQSDCKPPNPTGQFSVGGNKDHPFWQF
jgi:hypothetical protein